MTTITHPRRTTTPADAPTDAPVNAPVGKGKGTGRRTDADGMAVASFVMGLIGLLLFNAVFGPSAIALSLAALARGTQRRTRALLGLALGIADLIVLVVLVSADHSVFWNFG